MDAKGLGIIKIGCWLVISAPQKRKGKGVAGGGSHSQGPEGSLGSDRGTNRIAPATLAYQAVKSPFMHSISRYDRNIKSSFRPGCSELCGMLLGKTAFQPKLRCERYFR